MSLKHNSAFTKRVKRHVIAREKDFFIVVSPGFEGICLDELYSLNLPISDPGIVYGGIKFNGKINTCYWTNLHLRTANRILMRIDGFRASNFNRLEKRLSEIPWELYISGPEVSVLNVSSRHSRLYHKGAIAERVRGSLVNRLVPNDTLQEQGHRIFPAQELYVRVEDDRFTISIDSSGEALYKRGLKKHRAKAPIRETIAAAALQIAGFEPDMPLIDPMCGSGTFSLEALMMSHNIPSGWYRDFAFMGWPCFMETTWRHITRESEKGIQSSSGPMILASDQGGRMCRNLEKRIKEHGFSKSIRIMKKDFFRLTTKVIQNQLETDKPGLIVLNPPYGLRLETGHRSRILLNRIWAHLLQEFKGWKLAIFVPEKSIPKKLPFKMDTHKIAHGGLSLMLLTGAIP